MRQANTYEACLTSIYKKAAFSWMKPGEGRFTFAYFVLSVKMLT